MRGGDGDRRQLADARKEPSTASRAWPEASRTISPRPAKGATADGDAGRARPSMAIHTAT